MKQGLAGRFWEHRLVAASAATSNALLAPSPSPLLRYTDRLNTNLESLRAGLVQLILD